MTCVTWIPCTQCIYTTSYIVIGHVCNSSTYVGLSKLVHQMMPSIIRYYVVQKIDGGNLTLLMVSSQTVKLYPSIIFVCK